MRDELEKFFRSYNFLFFLLRYFTLLEAAEASGSRVQDIV